MAGCTRGGEETSSGHGRVTRRPDTKGAIAGATHGLWATTASPGTRTSPLRGDHVADVVVIGAGFTGCSAALHLAEAGQKTIVLEGEEIGFGGAGRNVGLVNAGMWTMPDHARATIGADRGDRLVAQLSNAPALVFDLVARHGIECEATSQGTLHCARGRRGLAQLSERARQWRLRDADVELLDSKATAVHTGSSAFGGALLDRRAGTIQPLAYVRGLAAAARKFGAVFHEGSAVTAIGRNGAEVRITTEAGTVRARAAIISTDAYSTGPFSTIRREQVMLPYFNLATEPLDQQIIETILPFNQGAWDTNRVLTSFRRDQAGRVIFGSVGALQGIGEAVHRTWAKRALARLFPQLGNVDFSHGWYGMIGMTDDAIPRFHQLDRSVFSISGYNGRGIAPGTTFGRDLARIAIGDLGPNDLALPITAPRDSPMRGARSLFYAVGAQTAHLAGARL